MALLCASCPVTSAQAQAPGFNDPSLDQYVESVPTGRGPAEPTRRAGSRPAAPLPASARAELREQGGADAGELEALATSPALGAPGASGGRDGREETGGETRSPRGGDGAGRSGAGQSLVAPADQGAAGAAASAVTDGGAAVWILVAGLALVTALIGAVALGRRRSDGSAGNR